MMHVAGSLAFCGAAHQKHGVFIHSWPVVMPSSDGLYSSYTRAVRMELLQDLRSRCPGCDYPARPYDASLDNIN